MTQPLNPVQGSNSQPPPLTQVPSRARLTAIVKLFGIAKPGPGGHLQGRQQRRPVEQ